MAALKIMNSIARACSGIQTQPCLCCCLALFTKPPFTTSSLQHPISVLCFSVLIKFLSPLSSPPSHFFSVCYFYRPRLQSTMCKVNSGEYLPLTHFHYADKRTDKTFAFFLSGEFNLTRLELAA